MSKDIKNIKIDTPSLIIFHEKFLNNILKLKNFFLILTLLLGHMRKLTNVQK